MAAPSNANTTAPSAAQPPPPQQQQQLRRQYASFRDRRYFPSYDELPHETEYNDTYYVPQRGVIAKHRKHWAFLSEIESVEQFTRLVLNVRDGKGNKVRVAFYTDDSGRGVAPKLLRPRYTVVNLYGLGHDFIDGSSGIRQEETSDFKIIPMSMDDLLKLSDNVQVYSVEHDDGQVQCHGCDQKKEVLQKCSKCHMFWYCSRDCQVVGWSDKGHKKDCPIIRDKDVKSMFELEWATFGAFVGFPLP